MRFGRASFLLTALIGAALAASLPAMAARTAFRYDATQRVTNACVLGVNGQTVAGHPNPYIIEGIRRSDLTPDDWTFENPLAPATVIEGDLAADFVVKGKRDYWFVPLTDDTANQLVGMDLIYISAPDLDLTPREQNGLRAAVEAGAVLWVDNDIARNAGGNPTGETAVTAFPWVFSFDYNAGGNIHALEAVDPGNSLLRDPYALSAASIARLGDRPDRAEYDAAVGGTLTEGHFIDTLGTEFRTIINNVQYNGAGVVQGTAAWAIAADYGSGSVLVTAGGVGRDVAEWILERESGGTNWRPSPDFLQAPDVKFALNVVQWNDRWQQVRRTPRASATSVARAPFPLDIAWQYPDSSEDAAAVAIGAVVSTPVQSRNLLYALSVPSTVAGAPAYLMCFDMTPEDDRDGDSMADDGLTDYSGGAPYDMVWRVALDADMTPRYASPTLTSYNDPNNNLGNVADDVFYPQVALISYVDTSNGEAWVDCYDASIPTGGTLLWRRQIEGYSASAQIVSLSTPIVHRGYVYVLASEYDTVLSGAGDPDSTYTRAHCFELDYPWTVADPWPTDGSWWVYPSSLVNIDGIGTDESASEPQNALPPVDEPRWVAAEATMYPPPQGRTPLPPAPGALPVVHAVGTTIAGAAVDALLTFGTPFSNEWDDPDIEIDNGAGGSQYTLVPTPFREDDESPAKPGYASAALPWGIGLNHDHFALRMNEVINDPPVPVVTTLDGSLVDEHVSADGDRYVIFSPSTAREAAIQAAFAGGNPLEAQLGVEVEVDYNGLADPEAQRLSGPVAWRRALKNGQRPYQPASMSDDEIAVTSGRPVQYQYLTPPPNPPAGSGAITEMDASSGITRWSYDPTISIPQPGTAPTMSTTAAAFDDETLIVGASAVDYSNLFSVSSIIGLQRQIDMQIDLAGGTAGAYPSDVFMLWPGGVIHQLAPSSYNVDPWAGRLMFPAASAAEMIDIDGYAIPGPVYGRAIRVVWPDGTTEDHFAPDIERFHVTPGFIRLRYRPFDPATTVITRPDGTAIAGAAWLNAPLPFGGTNAVLDGWVDLRAALDADGVAVAPGDEVYVSYTGWSEANGGWVTVPSAGLNIATEHHQLSPVFGPSLSSPAVAGDTIHLGTQGRDRDLDGVFEPAAPNPARAETLLSLMWNKATGYVRTDIARPARQQPGVAGIPVVSGSPSIAEDSVFVGSRIMSTADNTGIGYGYVSALKPWRVLLCDSNRIVETTGSDPSWVCTGTSSPQRAQSFVGEDLRRPFSRPAKAARLDTDNILVVDTGNHRVVEIDRAGRVVWPLDQFGYEYYTSPDNHDLKLSRPADAHRYWGYVTENVGGTPRTFPVMHTVVADTGNARVVEISTTFYDPISFVQDGRQRHTITTLTPAYVRVGTSARGYERVRYTSSAPITDPVNGAVIGYLCAASNLNQLLVVTAGNRIVNPYASVAIAGGTAGSTWAQWAWLYDEDPADGNNVSSQPLQFENIKHVDLSRIGGTIYMAVTCSRYLGRSGDPRHALAAEGAGVFEFRIDASGAPAAWQLDRMGTGAAWPTADPHWFFVGDDYRGRTMTTITTAAAGYDKRWYPVCSQRVRPDTVLVTNSLSQIESATTANIGAGVRNAVLGSHIFEVETDDGGDANPTNDAHSIDPGRSVPAPGEMWADPFVQPAYAEVR